LCIGQRLFCKTLRQCRIGTQRADRISQCRDIPGFTNQPLRPCRTISVTPPGAWQVEATGHAGSQ
jgi:hypothetical protein